MTKTGVCAPKGFKAAGIHCGIRKNTTKKDLALLLSDVRCTAAAVYTQNRVYGAPITVTRQNIADGYARAVICNSGNANTCNADGVEKAQAMCDLTAAALGIDAKDVVVASTGVIGQPLNIEPIAQALPALAAALSEEGGSDAAQAIMTTDTVQKEVQHTFEIGGKTVTIGAMAKGSGMIHPNMATMLIFITTDAAISSEMLHKSLLNVTQDTYNMISVDGDTSTNDMVTVLASGLAGNAEITAEGADYEAFTAALFTVARDLSRRIASDGEGATRLVECTVSGAQDKQTARVIAKSVICSSLVKTALFAADANWGRILCAMGYAGVYFTVEKASVSLASCAGSLPVYVNGAGVAFDEDIAKEILSQKEVCLNITLGDGDGTATAWGCDLSYEYVRINGDYRT